MGEDLGGAVKGFKKGMKEASADDAKAPDAVTQQRVKADDTIDVQAKERTDV